MLAQARDLHTIHHRKTLMENVEHLLSKLSQRLADQDVRLEDLEASLEAHQLVLAWLLHQQPDSRGLRFLSRQANEFDRSDERPKVLEIIAQLDALRALVLHLPDADGR